MNHTDRRSKRSSDLVVALHYQLDHCRREGALEAIVVADASGIAVAGAGAWATCEELAAYAPLLTPGGDEGIATMSRLAELRGHVDVQAVDVEGQTLLLCARGGQSRSQAMNRAARGVARILKTAA